MCLLDTRVASALTDDDLASVDLDGPTAAMAVTEMNDQRTELSEVGWSPDPSGRDIHELGQEVPRDSLEGVPHAGRLQGGRVAKRSAISLEAG